MLGAAAPLAQSVEQLTLNQWVPGSSPGGRTGATAFPPLLGQGWCGRAVLAEWAARRRAIGLVLNKLTGVLKINPAPHAASNNPTSNTPSAQDSAPRWTTLSHTTPPKPHHCQPHALAGSSDLIRLPRTNSTPPGTGNSAGWHLTIAARPTHTRPHHIS